MKYIEWSLSEIKKTQDMLNFHKRQQKKSLS